MPRGDRTGPRGLGPRTGRGLGFCAGYSTPGYVNVGRRVRRLSPNEEALLLKKEAKVIQKALNLVNKRLAKLQSRKKG